jgi:hypothetical protein
MPVGIRPSAGGLRAPVARAHRSRPGRWRRRVRTGVVLTMRKRVLIALAGASAALALTLSAPALASARIPSVVQATHIAALTPVGQVRITANVADGAYTNCSNGYFCTFSGTDGTQSSDGLYSCEWPVVPPYAFSLNVPIDCGTESMANRTGDIVRLYYGGHLNGAWVCAPAGYYNNDVANIDFNNGPTDSGYGESVWNNVGSMEIATGSCSNPL